MEKKPHFSITLSPMRALVSKQMKNEKVHRNALVLTGGGARAAYQVGALRAISAITKFEKNPFPIISGFSAGAINGTWLASQSENFDLATKHMWNEWSDLRMDKVFKTGTFSMLSIVFQWIKDRGLGGAQKHHSISHLLDTEPLCEFLQKHINFDELKRNLDSANLYGLSMISANYHTGQSTSFFAGSDEIKTWKGLNRVSIRADIRVEHVMASSAIPIFFPPVRVGDAFYGDGMVRLSSPLSPAIHMGADKILVIGIRGPNILSTAPNPKEPTISVGEIAGTILNGLFFDSLTSDIARMEKVNRTVSYMSRDEIEKEPDHLRHIPLLSLHPSEEVAISSKCELSKLPPPVRYMLKGLGVTENKGQDLLSYLAFEPKYVGMLLELGYEDTMKRKDEILSFFEGNHA